VVVQHDNIDSAELFRRYYTFVSSFVLRMGMPASDVDDVVQDVFMSAHRKGGYVAGPVSPKTWLARLALGVVSTAKRGKRRRREQAEADMDTVSPGSARTPADAAETAQSLGRVQRALDSLDLDRRAVFVLFELEGSSCEEIATGLGLPVGTVYSRLHAARRTFMDQHARLLAEEARAVERSLRTMEARGHG
jgi:RNA polymerase sigma-70 factor (ECF subfamily)